MLETFLWDSGPCWLDCMKKFIKIFVALSWCESPFLPYTKGVLLDLDAVVREWMNCGHEEMHMVSNYTQRDCGIKTVIDWPRKNGTHL